MGKIYVLNILIVIILILSMPSTSLRYSGEDIAIEEKLSSRTFEGAAEFGESPPVGSSPVIDGGSSSGGSGGDRIVINTGGPEAPVGMDKLYYPNTNDGYPINGEIGVLVEIRNIKNKGINGLSICERIDEELDRVCEPVCYLTYYGNKSWIIMNKLKSGKKIDEKNDSAIKIPVLIDNNKTTSINLKRLGVKARLIYFYKIKPKKIGSFLTGTVITFNENEYPDIDRYWEGDCRNPIQVLISPEKTHVYTGLFSELGGGSTTSITYNIEYENLSSNNQTVKGRIYKSNEFEIRSVNISGKNLKNCDGRRFIEFDLDYGIDKKLELTINYKSDNDFPAPLIYLDNVPYPENIPPIITAESFINSRSALISLIILLIINILTLIYTTRLQAKAERKSLEVFSNHMGDHLDQIAKSSHLILLELEHWRRNCNSRNLEDSEVYYEISGDD